MQIEEETVSWIIMCKAGKNTVRFFVYSEARQIDHTAHLEGQASQHGQESFEWED